MSIYTSYHSYSSSNNFSNSMTSSHTSHSGGSSGSYMSASGWPVMDEEMIRADDMREESFFAAGVTPVPLMVDPNNPPPMMASPEDVHMEFVPSSIPIPFRSSLSDTIINPPPHSERK